jgi:gliding motility-associated transport system permease protein
MQAYCTLTRRELAGYFYSLTGYVIIAAAMFLMGLSMVSLLNNLQGEPTPVPMTELFYNTWLFWIIVLPATPVITMRLFALEKFSGTYETLMTTPVSDIEVVAAKFTAALVFYMVMWLPLLGCIFILRHYTSDPAAIDAGAVGCTYLGIVLLGCLFIALGCFASALTRNQVTAAIISLVINFSLFLLSFLAAPLPTADWKSQALSLFGLPDQMHDFARGVVDTRPVVLYLSLAFCFLFLTLRVVESRRWK